MPRRKFIDKKTALNYKLVHRAQNDPRIHDAEAPDMVFAEVNTPNVRDVSEPAGSSRASHYSSASRLSSATGRSQIKSRGELEREFGLSARNNEGEAANHGIYYDDTEYDYMQHMRDLGSGGGEAYFIEAPADKKKGKKKMDLADALRAASLDDRQSDAGISLSSSVSRAASDVFGEDMAPSEFVRKTTYQDQQNIPDAIAGFQPDMDPRLREVLEALEDEAYVEDEEDFFAELTDDPRELNQRDFESSEFEEGNVMDRFLDEEDEGWETDDTIKASSPKPKKHVVPTDPDMLPAPDEAPAPAEANHMAFMEEFKKFKNDTKASKASKPAAAPSDMQSSVLTGASALTEGGRRKKRKGALTSSTSYSMTSSALHRTEGLTLLDQRFDKIEEEYAQDEFPDDASMVSGMSKMSGFSKMSGLSGISGVSGMSNMSEAPQLRSDFDNIMDDFLGSHSMAGNSKTRIRKGKPQSGIEQLDEVRKGLGPARFYAPKTRKV
ncbi:Low temperature viability protein [Periconia macrospinosa]|uniref:Low temperature viability protein n=1 Tax=Periconia macrospinosa TaxID=97972 RepID=A0A2V1ECC8_9PLEO|nr:Low temperature viability protein [Periconia macrospinosa]